MTNYRLANVFNDQYTYIYTELTNIDAEAECFICKSPYFPHDPEGCQAIQLQPCGHIIGHQCFTEWISRTSEMCPYWSHDLPRVLTSLPSSEDLQVKVLRSVVNSPWITLIDKHHAEVLTYIRSLGWAQQAQHAIKALTTGTLTSREVAVLTRWVYFLTFSKIFFVPALLASFLLCLVVYTAQLLFFIVCGSRFGESVWLKIFVGLSKLWVALFFEACAYCIIARRVFNLGLRRSSAR
jgi:hypothetical protein